MTRAERSLAHVRRVLRDCVLSARSFDDALEAGIMLGTLNSRNIGRYVADEELEVRLFARHSEELVLAADTAPVSSETTDWLHLITDAYDFGGHTRLLEAFVGELARRGERQSVAVTNSAPRSFFERVMAAGATVQRVNGNLSARAGAILALGRQAETVVAYIHPEDLGAALAARQLRDEGRRIIFINHADHLFSYGPGAASVLLEVSGFGWRLTDTRRVTMEHGFLGIPVFTVSAQKPRALDGPILTIGRSPKYRPSKGRPSFPDFLLKLLARTNRTVEMIGPDGSEPWWSEVRSRYPNRVHYRGNLPFAETQARIYTACCYLDSFPVTGGTAFSQALASGLPVFGLRDQMGGYSIGDALRVNSVCNMIEGILCLLESGIEEPKQKAMRTRITKDYCTSAVTDRLSDAAKGLVTGPPKELIGFGCEFNSRNFTDEVGERMNFTLRPAKSIPWQYRFNLVARNIKRPWVNHPSGRRMLRWALYGTY